jgi:hypothetical protein
MRLLIPLILVYKDINVWMKTLTINPEIEPPLRPYKAKKMKNGS